jgi:hypothetical protein
MEVASTLAYYNTTTIMVVKTFFYSFLNFFCLVFFCLNQEPKQEQGLAFSK